MAQYQVDSERIAAAGSAVSASVSSIRDAVGTMGANLAQLQGVWTGGASAQFQSVFEQWRAAQQQMEASLESIQTALANASQVYSEAELQASRLFAG